MYEQEKFNPTEENIGLACKYWAVPGGRYIGCNFLKRQLEGRIQCGGFIDGECVFIITGKIITDLTKEQLVKLKTTVPLQPRKQRPD